MSWKQYLQSHYPKNRSRDPRQNRPNHFNYFQASRPDTPIIACYTKVRSRPNARAFSITRPRPAGHPVRCHWWPCPRSPICPRRARQHPSRSANPRQESYDASSKKVRKMRHKISQIVRNNKKQRNLQNPPNRAPLSSLPSPHASQTRGSLRSARHLLALRFSPAGSNTGPPRYDASSKNARKMRHKTSQIVRNLKNQRSLQNAQNRAPLSSLPSPHASQTRGPLRPDRHLLALRFLRPGRTPAHQDMTHLPKMPARCVTKSRKLSATTRNKGAYERHKTRALSGASVTRCVTTLTSAFQSRLCLNLNVKPERMGLPEGSLAFRDPRRESAPGVRRDAPGSASWLCLPPRSGPPPCAPGRPPFPKPPRLHRGRRRSRTKYAVG